MLSVRATGFNPRLPGGRRRDRWQERSHRCCFNPRLPGGRRPSASPTPARTMFQSTPSGGKATVGSAFIARMAPCFNPRLPGGRRPGRVNNIFVNEAFQSTPSGGKATSCGAARHGRRARFNPRLPGGRRQDIAHAFFAAVTWGFNPRLPGGRRRGIRSLVAR